MQMIKQEKKERTTISCEEIPIERHTEIWVVINYFHKQQTPWAFLPQNMLDEHSEALEPAPPPWLLSQKSHL